MSIYTITNRLRLISRYLRHIGNFALAAMMFLTTADVIGRNVFNSPVLGAFEITEYLMVMVVFSFLAHAQAEKAHISVDILYDRLPYPIQAIFHRINHLACFLITLLMAWMGIERAAELINNNQMSTLLKIPVYPFAVFLVIGFTVLSIEFFIDFITPYPEKEDTKL